MSRNEVLDIIEDLNFPPNAVEWDDIEGEIFERMRWGQYTTSNVQVIISDGEVYILWIDLG